jgi:DNA-binding transcriptional ArsR family regulator
MRGEPDVASVAALIGDPSRAAMLAALADRRALPAGELAAAAGLSLSGASAQLARLTEGGLLTMEREGRHRYYRVAGPQVASALEGLALLAVRPRRPRARSPLLQRLGKGHPEFSRQMIIAGTGAPQRFRRRCLVMAGEGKRLEVTAGGRQWLSQVLGIETARLVPGRHGIARRCLDWTERRHHVAGPLGAALLNRFRELGWVTQAADSAGELGHRSAPRRAAFSPI